VRDVDDRQPLRREPLDELEHLPRLRDAERRRRLVEEDDAVVPHDGARHGDRLPLTAGERGDRLSDGADRGHGERRERLGGALLHGRFLESEEQVALLPPEVHVLDDVEVVAESEILVHNLDPELGRIFRAVDRHRRALEEDLAVVDRVDPGDALDQRRLPGAVVTDERHDLPVANLEVDAVQRLNRPEVLGDTPELERGSLLVGHSTALVPRSRAREARPRPRDVSYVQYFLYWPTQTWLRFRKPSLKRSL
jgi:hypothetical protein